MNFDGDEVVVRTTYDTIKRKQETLFLTSQGVYRLLYTSKKEVAKKFRKWAGNILDDIIFNESAELKRQLNNQAQLLLEKDQRIEQLENKPETCGFDRTSGYIYFVEDTTKPGHIKLGNATIPNNRISSLNVGSSTYSLKIVATFETYDKEFAEKIVHYSLNPFRIKSRKEWFYFKNNREMMYALNSIKSCIEFIKKFDITSFETNENNETNKVESLKEFIENLTKEESLKAQQIKEIQKELQKEKQKITSKINGEKSKNRTDNFKGTTFVKDKQLWKSEIQHNNNRFFLGYFTDEVDAAKCYNDYVAYLNQTENTNFVLNNILGYKTVARNIPEENKDKITSGKSSKYIGVSYDSKRKYYVSGIKLGGITYNLGNNIDEVECAKLYNQQAMFFNNTLDTKYILNNLNNYITIPKDIRTNTKVNKSSKYYGVSITTTNKWACSYMMNRKKIHIGTFNTELEACNAYNKTVIELNKNGCKYRVNTERI